MRYYCFFFLIEKYIHWHHYPDLDKQEHHESYALMSLIGDAAHNIVDGMIIGGSYFVFVPIGVATTVAVILHEIP